MKIAILGAGAWGSALATSFAAQHEISLWTRSASDCEALARTRASRYLPDVRLPDGVRVESDVARATHGAELVLVATATAGLRPTLAALGTASAVDLLWACKGFETATGALPHQVVDDSPARAARSAALSGPSFALEVARGQPTAVVIASRDAAFAGACAAALNSSRLRLYSSDDLVGVELGGALKNVIAIAAGISDGLGLGRNARAALVTRGLAEIARLGSAMGGRAETFSGLAGLGDLVLTCTGDLSRNRTVGIGLGRGQSLAEVLAGMKQVAEGVKTTQSARDLGLRLGVELPITEMVWQILYRDKPAAEGVVELLARPHKHELA